MNLSEKQTEALKEFLYKMADDQLILGHRNSEWTGLGPAIEEDIAFSSMAQDKIGHSFALYSILHELGEADPDTVAFTRNDSQFHCCHLVELPIGEYDFSLMRHFLFDHAEQLRFEMLAQSSFEPLAKVARKIKGELKYHVLHANTWMEKLGNGNEESRIRMQAALDNTFNLALGIFEESPFAAELAKAGIFDGETSLKSQWFKSIEPVLAKSNLVLPAESSFIPVLGGRSGKHTEQLQPLLEEMSEVFRIDPNAEW